jgi:hypothetical protein
VEGGSLLTLIDIDTVSEEDLEKGLISWSMAGLADIANAETDQQAEMATGIPKHVDLLTGQDETASPPSGASSSTLIELEEGEDLLYFGDVGGGTTKEAAPSGVPGMKTNFRESENMNGKEVTPSGGWRKKTFSPRVIRNETVGETNPWACV